MYAELTDEQIEYTIDAILNFGGMKLVTVHASTDASSNLKLSISPRCTRRSDVRVFHKECKALARSGKHVVLVAPHERDEIGGLRPKSKESGSAADVSFE